MLLILFLIFVVTPIVELVVIVQVAGSAGVMNTIGLLVLVSAAGAWLVRREGLGIIRRVQREVGEGRIPEREIVEGLLVLGAGALMLTPGFVTDAVGLFFLFPPTRVLVRSVTTRRLNRLRTSSRGNFRFGWRSQDIADGGGILDTDSWDGGLGGPDGPSS